METVKMYFLLIALLLLGDVYSTNAQDIYLTKDTTAGLMDYES